ncbi:MAG: response regulator transcription factor RpaB [Thainema sp.]
MVDQTDKILVVDDEAAVRRILTTRLGMVGYDVITAADGQEALEKFEQEAPDLVVLDVMMPKVDGYRVCQEIRQESDVPIIMLTALGDVGDRITGLKIGADDYLAKPFSPKELEARIYSILRRFKKTDRLGPPNPGVIRVSNIEIDTNTQQVYKAQQRIRLTQTEYNLLELLFQHSGEPVSRTHILEQVWGYASKRRSDLRVVDVYITRLRAKLEEDPSNPELIITIRGTGYLAQRLASSPTAERA